MQAQLCYSFAIEYLVNEDLIEQDNRKDGRFRHIELIKNWIKHYYLDFKLIYSSFVFYSHWLNTSIYGLLIILERADGGKIP